VALVQEYLQRCQGQANSGKPRRSQGSLYYMETPGWLTMALLSAALKELVANAVTLDHPKQDYKMCLFTDASDFHCGSILIQVPKQQLKVTVHDQEHEPTAFFSGSSNATQLRSSVIEKESIPKYRMVTQASTFSAQ